MKSNVKIKMSLRIKIAVASIITLCISCVISCLLVIIGGNFLYQGPMTKAIAVFMCLLACSLSIVFGGILLWFEAKYITVPITKIGEGVKKVAEGDFSVLLPLNKNYGRMGYQDEIDELADNFNKMTRELNNMDYMRKDFMSNISHEVKTPVSAITGFSEILLDVDISKEEQKEYLTYINQESIRLSKLSENMLHMSRLDNQVIVNKNTEVIIDEQIRKCIIMMTEKWLEKDINFELDLFSCNILSNSDLLYQVWMNLIDNAIKYSREQSTIWIYSQINNNVLKVVIKDEGIGINQEKRNKIFDKFYQCDESHKNHGSGLGLSIVKRILELLGGEIMCESIEGRGTTMTVTLPLSK